jgi:hypothetical protein
MPFSVPTAIWFSSPECMATEVIISLLDYTNKNKNVSNIYCCSEIQISEAL